LQKRQRVDWWYIVSGEEARPRKEEGIEVRDISSLFDVLLFVLLLIFFFLFKLVLAVVFCLVVLMIEKEFRERATLL